MAEEITRVKAFKRKIENKKRLEKNSKIKSRLFFVLDIYKKFPMTSFFMFIITIMNVFSLVIVDNLLYFKIYTGMIFPLFLFFALESGYFNIRFENEKEARTLKIWHYLFGITISLIFLMLFVNLYTYGSILYKKVENGENVLVDKVIQKVEYPNYIIQYGLIIFVILFLLTGLNRIKINLNLDNTTYLNFSFKKHVKLYVLFIIILALETILPRLISNFGLSYEKAIKFVFIIFNLALPTIIYPIILNILTNTKKIYKTNELLKKIIIYLVVPFSLIYSIYFVISNILEQFKDNIYVDGYIIVDYIPIFFVMLLIGVGLKIYLKEYFIEEKEKKSKIFNRFKKEEVEYMTILVNKEELETDKNNKEEIEEIEDTYNNFKGKIKLIQNEKERKYIKILSDLILIPLILLIILPLAVLIRIDINKTGLFNIDLLITLIVFLEISFIVFYLAKNYDIIKRHINYLNIAFVAMIIGFIINYWSLVGFAKIN